MQDISPLNDISFITSICELPNKRCTPIVLKEASVPFILLLADISPLTIILLLMEFKVETDISETFKLLFIDTSLLNCILLPFNALILLTLISLVFKLELIDTSSANIIEFPFNA